MTRLRPSILVLLFFAACSDGQDPDGGSGDLGELLDGGNSDATDALPSDRGPDGGDAEPEDAGVEDLGLPLDSGLAGAGESCLTAHAWPEGQEALVGTTSASLHREQLSCAGSGAGATAPEEWWLLELDRPQSVTLRLGTDRWDGVLGARTSTCTLDRETCADNPSMIELPNVEQRVYVAVDGFSTGNGRYVLTRELGEPWQVPPSNTTCTAAESILASNVIRAHNFGGEVEAIAPCNLTSAVFYSIETTGAPLSIRAMPSAAHDVELALLSECGQEAIACASTPGRGVPERFDAAEVPAGRYVLAVGTRVARPAPGSFELSISESASCAVDRDCPLDELCLDTFACAPAPGFTATSTARLAIPDGGELSIPLRMFGPSSRPREVYVRVQLEHDYLEDLVVELQSPGPSPFVVRLRDRTAYEADVSYGRERPADGVGSLADFALAETATGAWSLVVRDRAVGDRGFVTGVVLGVE
jgi:hypothetical protein